MSEAQPIRAVTVYCSASNFVHADYLAFAHRVGAMLASSGRSVIYGGGRVGLMGELARGAREQGGYVVGVITKRLQDAEQLDTENNECIVVNTMRERKAILESRADALLILPGGLGTMEEFFEILTGRLLGEHDKPIVMLNPADPDGRGRFYDPLLAMIGHMIDLRFAKRGVMTLFEVAERVEEVEQILHNLKIAFGAAPDRSHMLPTAPMS